MGGLGDLPLPLGIIYLERGETDLRGATSGRDAYKSSDWATALSGAKPTITRATRTAGNQRQGRSRGGFTRLPTVVRGGRG